SKTFFQAAACTVAVRVSTPSRSKSTASKSRGDSVTIAPTGHDPDVGTPLGWLTSGAGTETSWIEVESIGEGRSRHGARRRARERGNATRGILRAMQRPVLDPRLRPVVRLARWLERDEALPMPERRARMAAQARRGRWLVMPAGPRCRERDLAAPVEGGVVRVRLYEPPDGRGPLPLHVFLHGGGWCIGTLEERDPRCRQIAVGARCAVASVDYRLAPEHPYPVPLEDCYAALVWLVEQAADLGLDASRVSIGGESAGANLA